MASPATTTFTSPKITFWTNHSCPWAQRVQITLKELGLTYEEVIIDLDKPRDDWYLKINPRGTVPSLRYSNGTFDEIITESSIITQFLADAHPSHLLPASDSSPTAPLVRARVNFIVDTYFTKVKPVWMGIIMESSATEREKKGDELVRVVEKEVEPLLAEARPFFGGGEKLGLAEALISPFIQRLYDFADGDILPTSLPAKLDKLPNFSKWAKACRSHDSVAFNWEPRMKLQMMKGRIAKMRPVSTD